MIHPCRWRGVRTAFAGAITAGLLLLAGCYTKEEQGGVATYAFALWVPSLVALSGLALMGVGVMVFRGLPGHPGIFSSINGLKRVGVLLIFAGTVLLVCVPPMMLINKVTVDARHFEVVDCFLWNIERSNVAYDDVLDARLVLQETQTRRAGVVKKCTLELTTKRGPSQSIVVKNALKEAWPEVARELRARGFKNLPEKIPE